MLYRGLIETFLQREKERVSSMKQTQSKEEFTKLLAEAGNLQDVQAAKDPATALASIPRLPLEAIDRIVKPNIIQLRVEKDVLVATTRVPDSFGMLFVDFGLDLRLVDFEDAFLLPVLMKLMMTMPTKAWTEEPDLIGLHAWLSNWIIDMSTGQCFTRILICDIPCD